MSKPITAWTITIVKRGNLWHSSATADNGEWAGGGEDCANAGNAARSAADAIADYGKTIREAFGDETASKIESMVSADMQRRLKERNSH